MHGHTKNQICCLHAVIPLCTLVTRQTSYFFSQHQLLYCSTYHRLLLNVFLYSIHIDINKWSTQAWTGSLCIRKPEASVFHSISNPPGLLQQCS